MNIMFLLIFILVIKSSIHFRLGNYLNVSLENIRLSLNMISKLPTLGNTTYCSFLSRSIELEIIEC